MKRLKFLGWVLVCCIVYTGAIFAKTKDSKPIIGILLNDGGDGGYSQYPWYAIRKNYGQVVLDSGGIPVFIGHNGELIDDYLAILDGILLTGGDFNLPEEVYTTGIKNKLDPRKYPRAHFEIVLIQKAFENNIPVLGICAGMQDMNVALGGTLSHKIQSKTGIIHRNENREQLVHSITLDMNTKLYRLMQAKTLRVNSNHNEGINNVSSSLTISARASDEVIEAFEAPNKTFFIGVMWHPEFLLSEQERLLWQGFIAAAQEHHHYRVRD